ncbi:MAG: hypothetical protein QOH51_2147 [Acidobacteriota bacterium]|jgi:hypothetical protein|nr:hypothetical protein [Acidobacteriota bacterium]
MHHLTLIPRRRNIRAFIAAFISYLMLVGQIAPLALAAHAPVPGPVQASGTPATTMTLAAQPAPAPLFATGPVITATKVDAFPDPDADGKAAPGATITYTVTISNTGDAPATGVTFNDPVDTNTTLVPGSVSSQPIAINDTYNVVGNVRIQPNAAQGLLANDRDPDTGNNSGLTASGPTTGPTNGQATVASDGSFTYNPNPGFTGTDSFTYTISDGTKTDTATATLEVGLATHDKLIWFINASSPGGGDGRLTNPYNCLVGAGCFFPAAADDPGDVIFLFSGAYTGGLTLLNNEKFIGQGATDTLSNISGIVPEAYSDPLPSTGGASPTITTSAASTNSITLAQGNLLRGFTVGNTTGGAKIFGTGFGTLTAGNNSSPDLTLNGTGQALNLTNGAFSAPSGFNGVTTTSAAGAAGISLATIGGTVVFGTTNVSNSGTQGISISGSSMTATFGTTTVSSATTQGILIGTTTGSINFGATTVTGGTDGVSFQNNSGANARSFGTLGVSGGSGNAFLSGAGGGNVNVTGAANLSSALDPVSIQNMTTGTAIIFSGGATVSKTTAGGAGVNWGGTNTGATLTFATLAVTTSNGTGINLSGGGTVNVTTAAGSSISATGSAGQAAPAIISSGVTLGMNFATVSSTNSGNSGNGISLTNTPGTLTINGGSISGAAGDAFLVSGVTTSTANITYNGTISTSTARPVNISGKTGGTVAFGGAVSSTSNGVSLNSNTGATINFTGGLSLNTGANTAFAATAGGTVSATQNNTSIVNTLTTTTGTALNVANTTIGASGLIFRSITSNGSGSANGIILDTTGSTAGLTVTGNGGTCSSAATCTGGTISNKTGADGSTTQGSGIFLNSTSGVSIDRMQMNDFQNFGIKGSSVTGFSFTNSRIVGINGTTEAGGGEEGPIRFDNLFTSASFPTAQITGSTIQGAFSVNIRVTNTSGTLNRLVIDNCQLPSINSSNTNGGSAVIFDAEGTATLNWTLSNSVLSSSRASMVNVQAQGGTHMDMVVLQNKLQNANPNILSGAEGIRVQAGSAAGNTDLTFNISCNRISTSAAGGAKGAGINLFKAVNSPGGAMVGTVGGNAIGVVGQTLSGAPNSAPGIWIQDHGAGTFTTLIQNNNIVEYGEEGIDLQRTSGSSTLNASVFGNTVTPNAANGFSGLNIEQGAVNTDTGTMNLVVGNANAGSGQQNDFSNGDPFNTSDVQILKAAGAATVLNLSRNGSASATIAQVIKDDNVNGANTSVFIPTAGSMNLVNTLPTLPPAVAGCTLPTGPVTFNADTIAGPGSINTQTGDAPVAQPTGMSGGITSRPFVSPRPLAPRVIAPAPTTVARTTPATTQNTAATNGRTTPRGTVDPPIINGAGGNVSVSIGTLNPGDSVTITFQVVIDDPYSGGPNVSNQGTVSGSNFSNVLTDDPSIAGTANPTLTPVNSLNIFARDGSVAEPASGTTPLLFTVTLSNPAGAGGVSVNYATADDTGGTNPATGGAACDNNTVDYVTTSGTVNFAAGERVKTVSVSVCADNSAPDTDETLLLNLSGAVGGTILDAQAVGTITETSTPGTFLVSELRTSGPGGAGDDFVELYNNTDTPLTVAASDASAGFGVFKMGTDCNATPVLIATIPNGTIIPARGHFLVVGSQYSLGSYATGNQTMTSDIESDHNVAVFSTADIAAISTATRKDAVGFDGNTGGGVCDLLREGNTLPPVSGTTTQHSFFRKECDFVAGVGCTVAGNPKDTNDNNADFMFADTQGTFISGVPQHLGAPGPENLQSPIRRDAVVNGTLLDNSKSSSVSPNRVRDLTSNPGNNSTFGTLSIRRRFQNNSGANVTRLRFRIVEITTFPSPGGGQADLRAITSTNVSVSGVNDPNTCQAANGSPTTPCTVNVKGTTLEQPPTQPNGGGYNSTMADGTITLGTPLANGASANVQFLLGVQTTGTFRFLIIVEALP